MKTGAGALEALTIRDGTARAVVRPAHARDLCAGHFPGDPLLPGASLAELMAELAATLVGSDPEPYALAELVRCTFLTRIRPDQEIVVLARRRGGPDPTTVDAEVHTRGACAARAVLRFGARR